MEADTLLNGTAYHCETKMHASTINVTGKERRNLRRTLLLRQRDASEPLTKTFECSGNQIEAGADQVKATFEHVHGSPGLATHVKYAPDIKYDPSAGDQSQRRTLQALLETLSLE